MENLFIVSCSKDLEHPVLARNQKEAMDKFVKYYRLPEDGWQKESISIRFVDRGDRIIT